MLPCPAHTLFTPWIPINTPSSGPWQDVLGLPYCLPNSYLKNPPLYSVVLWKYACKPSFVWSNCRHPSTTIVYPITRHERRQLTTRVSHCKCISSCGAYEVQCCQLKEHKVIIQLVCDTIKTANYLKPFHTRRQEHFRHINWQKDTGKIIIKEHKLELARELRKHCKYEKNEYNLQTCSKFVQQFFMCYAR